jgi:probable HAF family extracellular repeat protein
MKALILTTVTLLAALAVAPSLLAQTYNIPWHSIGPGGVSAGGVYTVSGSIGQWNAGKLKGSNLTLNGGFWPGAIAAVGTVPPPSYNLVDLGTLNDNALDPRALNNVGQIAGYSYSLTGIGAPYALFWPNSSSSPQQLGALGGDGGNAVGINDSGEIVGSAYLPGNAVYHAAIWTNSTVGPLDLGSLGGSSTAASVNNSSQIVGYSFTPTNWSLAIFWPNANSSPLELSTLGGAYNYALSLNDSGQIVGASTPAGGQYEHAVFWTNSSSAPLDLGTLGLEESWARAINKLGQIVGRAIEYCLGYQVVPVYWPNGSSTPVTLATLGGNHSEAISINTSGRIVGYSATSLNGPIYAVLWNNGSSPPIDLNTLIPTNSGWVLQYANAINDFGEIVGTGLLNGQGHAFALISATSVSTPRITFVAKSGPDLQLSFTSQAGHTYNVLSTADLTAGSWSTLMTGIPGNGGTVQVTIPNAFSQPRQFFRIQQGP